MPKPASTPSGPYPPGDGPTRRDLLRLGVSTAVGGLVAGAPVPAAAARPAQPEAAPPGQPDGPGPDGPADRTVRIQEGTNICAAVSPDGQRVAIDLVSVLWLVPIGGGTARRLTDDLQDATQPAWSPDGRHIVFQSYRDGFYHIWTVEPGGLPRQLTSGPWHDQEPRFGPDGRSVVFASDRDGASNIWRLDLASGRLDRLTAGSDRLGMPVWSADGSRLAFTVDEAAVDVLEPRSGARTRLVDAVAGVTVYGPSFAPDGRLAYTAFDGVRSDLVVAGQAVTTGEDVFGFAPSWLSDMEIVYTADGRIRRRRLDGAPAAGGAQEDSAPVRDIGFVATVSYSVRDYPRRSPEVSSTRERTARGIVSPVLSPDGTRVAFRALGALWLMELGGPARQIRTGGGYATDPDWAPDGRSLVYVSDRAGTANLWSYELATGRSRRLTDRPDAQLAPRYSPAGDQIAYQDEAGATWVLRLADGSARQVAPAVYNPGRPTWSPDGTVLALAAVRPAANRSAAGTNQIMTVRLATGAVDYQPVAAYRSISSRGADGPVWLPQGALAVVMDGVAWLVPVDRDGRVTGEPRQLTDEVADGLSAGNHGRTLAYLCNGELRLLDLAERRRRTVPLRLTWRRRRPGGRVVLRPDAVWDGAGDRLRSDVDIVVDGDRIVELAPRGSGAGPVTELAGLTAMPGLIDAHNHWHMRGGPWGDRQGRLWLAYGVTTSRSPGDPAYRIVETREAVAAGTQVGPRVLACGEALDGHRLYYSFNRCVTSPEQVAREVSRAVALEYDLLKTYMRLPVELCQQAVQLAHRHGIPVTSHYLYPNANLGYDGQEHTAGGNRLGYSHTASRTGTAYQDAVELFARSGMWISSTLLYAQELYRDDRSLVDDERTRVLFTPWEYQRLVAKVEEAKSDYGQLLRAWNAKDGDMLLRIHRRGGLVVAGTDAPLDDIGVSMHQNLRSMVKYGFRPDEALRTATVSAARAVNLANDLGRLAAGRLADLAFVEGDPLADINAAAAVRAVMVGGHLHTVDNLLAPYQPGRSARVNG